MDGLRAALALIAHRLLITKMLVRCQGTYNCKEKIVMVCLKLLIICVVFMEVSGDQCEEQPLLSFVVCDNAIEHSCNNSVALSQVFDILGTCEMTTSCEPSHQYSTSSICCNSTCYYSVEIMFGSDYTLSENHTLIDLDNVLFGSLNSYSKFTVSCIHDDNIMNTGFTFIAVRNLTIENLNIIGCGTIHVSTSSLNVGEFLMFYSAVFIQNSTDVTLHDVTISDSNGKGLTIIDTNGTVEITDSIFRNNTIDASRNLSGGGGIYVEFTECSPNITDCNSTENYFNRDSVYNITKCSFVDNTASYFGSDYNDDVGTYIVIGRGGGMLVLFFGQALNNKLYVHSSNFCSNQANQGGGITVHVIHNASLNQVYITDCLFHNNVAFDFQGGGVSIGFVNYEPGDNVTYNNFTVNRCKFIQNEAPNGAGGGLSWYGSEPSEPTNSFVVINSTFLYNKAQVGFAMQVNDLFHLITNGRTSPLIVKDCNFTNNGVVDSEYLAPLELSSQTGSVGAVSSSGVGIQFQGHTTFGSNFQTALVVDRQQVEFYKDSVTVFEDNSGLHGGAILLMGGAWIETYPNSTVTFSRNTAVINGAAIYVQLMTPFDFILSYSCFFRYYKENVPIDKWNTSFLFFNNATEFIDIETIFITTLRPCQNFYSYKVVVNEKPFCFCEDYQCNSCLNNTAGFVATSPAVFCNLSNETFHVIPGKVENMNICVLDELNNSISGTQFTAACTNSNSKNCDESPCVLPAYQVTQSQIQIAGKPQTICQLQLQTIADFQITRTFNILLLNCPPGFFFNAASAQCECLTNHRNRNPAISSCEPYKFQAYINPSYWIGYELDLLGLLMGRCPLGYCYKGNSLDMLLPSDVLDRDTLDHFVCNSSYRTGRLCSECIEGYSVAINSPTFACEKCKTSYKLGILFLFLSYIVPVSILFYIIMAYDIRMTTAPIGAFLFFAQIVGSHYHSHIVYSININNPSTLDTSNVLYGLYSISNLVFFNHDIFSFCLFKKAGTADIKAFELLLSFYPVLLII
ncbi:uncharacterized protein [Dysidea avara]|uniref:uncharacterized protein n=1 Tax=Dysidea avara TaxID=196820 RepID=UPI003329CBE8